MSLFNDKDKEEGMEGKVIKLSLRCEEPPYPLGPWIMCVSEALPSGPMLDALRVNP